MTNSIEHRVWTLEMQSAARDERDKRIEKNLSDLSTDIGEIKEYATKWRGGFATILLLGSLLGGLAMGWDHIVHFFK